MKLSLGVLTAGKWQGKVLPIRHSPFVIGRDPDCDLRPVSASVSKRHCALVVRSGRVFLQDFGSTNGTFVNDRQAKGEVELRDQDRLRVGPLEFLVCLETAAVESAAPGPAAPMPATDDPSLAGVLLSDDTPQPGVSGLDSQDVPTGDTVHELPPPAPAAGKPAPPPKPPPPAWEVEYSLAKGRVEQGALVLTVTEPRLQTERQADVLRHELIQAVDKSGSTKVAIDLRNVEVLSSTGLRAFIGVYRHLKKHKGGQLVLFSTSPIVARTLTTTRLVGMSRSPFDMRPDLAGALTFLKTGR